MTAGLVSTIIPVYNRAALLREAVASVLAQTYRPIEVIVVDDGSTDDTAQACSELAQAHAEVRTLRIANSGPGLAREAGRGVARGEFVQYLDSDDILRPRKFELQVAALRARSDCGACYGPTEECRLDQPDRTWPSPHAERTVEFLFPDLLAYRPWQTPAPLLRRSVTDVIGAWTGLGQEEDIEYDARLAALGVRLARVPDVVATIRHPARGRASGGSLRDPRRMRWRAQAHMLVYAHARRAGIGPEDVHMQRYARELFLLSRQAGAAGLLPESRDLFALAREASGAGRSHGWDFRLYGAVTALIGWTAAGRLACWGDGLRSGGEDAPVTAIRKVWSAEALWMVVRIFSIALVLTTLLNGAGVFLKRVGALEPERYEAFWVMRCGPAGTTSAPLGLGRRCALQTFEEDPSGERNRREEPYRRYLHQVEPSAIWLKLGKDGLVLGLVLFSLYLIGRGSAAMADWPAWTLWGLSLVVLVAGMTALLQGRPMEATLGVRAFGFLALALVGSWAMLGDHARLWAAALLPLLVVEALIMPWESLWGLPVYGNHAFQLPRRLAGTLVQPNTLGVFAVSASAFIAAFGKYPPARLAAWVVAVLLVAGAGSATGWIALLALAVFCALGCSRTRLPVLTSASLALALLLVCLPKIVGRPDVYASIAGPRGRLDQLEDALSGPPLMVLFGRGLGSGTNASMTLDRARMRAVSAPADSTITLLLRQTGLLGMGLFYAGLLAAWRRDPVARPFYLVTLVTSVTSNLPEVFPVNVLLGLALAHSFTRGPLVEGTS